MMAKTVSQLHQLIVPAITVLLPPEILHLSDQLKNSLVLSVTLPNQCLGFYKLFQSWIEEPLLDIVVTSNRISEFDKDLHAFAVDDVQFGTFNLLNVVIQLANQGRAFPVVLPEKFYYIHVRSLSSRLRGSFQSAALRVDAIDQILPRLHKRFGAFAL